MTFLKYFFRNLAIFFGVFIFMGLFTWIFYPEALPLFKGIGEFYTGLKIWPIIILVIIASCIPRRSKWK
jgi:hypothetical protein